MTEAQKHDFRPVLVACPGCEEARYWVADTDLESFGIHIHCGSCGRISEIRDMTAVKRG